MTLVRAVLVTCCGENLTMGNSLKWFCLVDRNVATIEQGNNVENSFICFCKWEK